MNRRSFVAAAAASTVLGANDQIRGAIIGSGGRGRYLTEQFKEIGVPMMAVCDVYEPNLQKGLQSASTGAKPYDNYKKMLEDKSIDVVVVATPDHWHAQMTIDAVNAGKDVYVEKPLAHTVEDGFRMIDAVRKTRRIVQVGTQRRSFELFQDARTVMQSGAVGDVRLVNGWWVNHQKSLREVKQLEGKLDWHQWLGPAPKRDVDPMRFYNWYYFWDYSGGLMVGQAAHGIDAIHWLMGASYPKTVTTSGGRVNLDGAEVPETTCICADYPENFLSIFTVGYKAMRYNLFNDQLTQYHGNKARFDVGRESYSLYPESPAIEMKPSKERKEPGAFVPATRMHIRNFLECVRDRKEPNAPVEVGQQTNVVLCMAMESLRKGKRLEWDAARRRVVG